jgi:hypothetical protein
MNNVKDYYQILNVKRSASDDEIATAYVKSSLINILQIQKVGFETSPHEAP